MKQVKIIYLVIVFLISSHCIYSQGELIIRKTKLATDFNLKILEVSADSITYKHTGRTKTIPLSSIIAYRCTSKQTYVFPDPKDMEVYIIRDGEAYNKKETSYNLYNTYSKKEKAEYISTLLKNNKLANDTYWPYSLNHNITLYPRDSSELIEANPRRKLFIILKNDPLRVMVKGKIYKITNDSILYLTLKMKRDTTFYAIKLKDIKIIGLESQKSHARRIFLGACSLVLIAIPPFAIIPIGFFAQPTLQPYDIQNKWKLTLTEQGKISNNKTSRTDIFDNY